MFQNKNNILCIQMLITLCGEETGKLTDKCVNSIYGNLLFQKLKNKNIKKIIKK